MPPHVSKLSINRHLPFLDLNVFRGVQGNLEISVYRKPTHTDKYLAFDPHHPICHKKSVAKTLLRRTDCLPSSLDSKAFSVTSKNQLQLVTLLMKGNQRLVLLLFLTFRVLRNPSREFWIATTLKLLKNLFRLRQTQGSCHERTTNRRQLSYSLQWLWQRIHRTDQTLVHG